MKESDIISLTSSFLPQSSKTKLHGFKGVLSLQKLKTNRISHATKDSWLIGNSQEKNLDNAPNLETFLKFCSDFSHPFQFFPFIFFCFNFRSSSGFETCLFTIGPYNIHKWSKIIKYIKMIIYLKKEERK